jgi:hypothetical protein
VDTGFPIRTCARKCTRKGAHKGGHHVERGSWRGFRGSRPCSEFGRCHIRPDKRITCLQGSQQLESIDSRALHLFAAWLSRPLLSLELSLIPGAKQRQAE